MTSYRKTPQSVLVLADTFIFYGVAPYAASVALKTYWRGEPFLAWAITSASMRRFIEIDSEAKHNEANHWEAVEYPAGVE